MCLIPLGALEVRSGSPGLEVDAQELDLRGMTPAISWTAADGTGPGSWSPTTAGVATDQQVMTPAGPARATTWQWDDPAAGWRLAWTLTRPASGTWATLRLAATNRSTTARHLETLTVARGALHLRGEPAAWWTSTLDSHDSSKGGFQPAAPLTATGEERSYLDLLALARDGGRSALVVAAVGPPQSDLRLRIRPDALSLTAEMAVRMDPGETRQTDDVLLVEGTYDAGIAMAVRWIAATHGSRTAQGPLVGWCSWYDRAARIDAAHIAGVTAAVAADRARLPCQVIQIDDGWEKAYGDWTVDTVKFPAGLAPLVQQIQAAGALPGIWIAPIRTSATGFTAPGRVGDYLDPTHPEVIAFIRTTIQARLADGFRYFKLDFNNVRARAFHDPKATRLQAVRRLFALYREVLGEDTYLLACVGGPTRGPVGYVDAARIGTDSVPVWGGLWKGCTLQDCLNAVGTSAPVHGVWYASDADVAYLRPRKELDEAGLRAWLGVVGLSGGLGLVSEPFHEPAFTDPAVRDRFSLLAPPVPTTTARLRSAGGGCDPLHHRLVLAGAHGPAVVQLTNPGSEPLVLDLRGTGLAGPHHAWSFWNQGSYGVIDPASFSVTVPPRSAELLRLTPVPTDGRPFLVGDSLHLGMGLADVLGETWDPASGTLTVEFDAAAGRRDGGQVAVATPPGSRWRLAEVTGCTATLVRTEAQHLVQVALDGRTSTGRQRLVLAREP